MHLGNVWAALLSWLSAKSRGGTWLLRIEDLDSGRSRPEWARLIEDDLAWLGLEWDEGGLEGRGCVDGTPCLQSLRGDIYREYFDRLERRHLVYPCRCRRTDILAAQAPHESDGRVVYPGICRPAPGQSWPHTCRGAAARLVVPDSRICYTDMLYGPQTVDLALSCGDFVVRRADGSWAYQLAVVVDDALMGVTEVVRGCDLLLSAAQQQYLQTLLGFGHPRWGHVPLLCNAEGRRLSKRDASLSMEVLRRTSSPGAVIGRLAWLAGLITEPEAVKPAELIPLFSWERLPATRAITLESAGQGVD